MNIYGVITILFLFNYLFIFFTFKNHLSELYNLVVVLLTN